MSTAGEGRRLPLDVYHAGVRLGTLVWWLAASAVLFAAGVWISGLIFGPAANWVWLPWLVITLLLSQFVGRWGERWLMRHWSSGRALELAGPRLVLQEPAGAQTFDLGLKVNYWRWGFQVRERRGGRVPNGHFCFALRLVQSAGQEASACVYAFLPPAEAAALRARYPCYELRRANDQPLAAGVVGGRDPGILAVEKLRWEAGAELEAADLQALLDHLAKYCPNFNDYLS